MHGSDRHDTSVCFFRCISSYGGQCSCYGWAGVVFGLNQHLARAGRVHVLGVLGASAHLVGEAHDSGLEDARVRELEGEIEPVVGEYAFAFADDDGKLDQVQFVDQFVLEQPPCE